MKIKLKGDKVLESQFKKARGKSRKESKKNREDKKLIFSIKSLNVHKNNWASFVTWLEINDYKINRLGQIKPIYIENYIKYLANQGYSKKTLQTRISAVNKVMGTRFSENEKPKLSKMDVDVKKTKGNSYKHLTAREWTSRNEARYIKYKDLFDTISAFGLRKSEMRELNYSSFLIDKNNKIYVQTIGKGGKYRVACCVEKMNDKMVFLYKNCALRIDNIEDFNGSKEYLRKAIKSENLRLNLPGVYNEKNKFHIFRSLYAEEFLNERIAYYDKKLEGEYGIKKQGYSTINIIKQEKELEKIYTQIGRFVGSSRAFLEVSNSLGHNRLDVMRSYIC